jgi:hypothetical protein
MIHSHKHNVGGLVISQPLYTPIARFFQPSSIETGNGAAETAYKAQRANWAVCDTLLSGMELQMNDVIFHYAPVITPWNAAYSNRLSHYDYRITHVRTYEQCLLYDDYKKGPFHSPSAKGQAPSLPIDICSDFAACDDTSLTNENDDMLTTISTIVTNGARITFIVASPDVRCNFYIATPLTEGMRWNEPKGNCSHWMSPPIDDHEGARIDDHHRRLNHDLHERYQLRNDMRIFDNDELREFTADGDHWGHIQHAWRASIAWVQLGWSLLDPNLPSRSALFAIDSVLNN